MTAPLAGYLDMLPRISVDQVVVPGVSERFLLSEITKGEYDKDGYVVVQRILDPTLLQQLNRACDRLDWLVARESRSVDDFNLEAEGGGWRGQAGDVASITGCLRKVKNLVDHSSIFLALALHPAMVAIAHSLLNGDGDVALHSKGFLMNKAPGTETEKRWHQDSAYFEDPHHEVVTLWAPLQDTDISNGTLWAIAGSHRDGPLAHCGPEAHLELAANVLATARPIPMRGGDVFVSHRHTLHYSGPNRASSVRRAIIFRYHIVI